MVSEASMKAHANKTNLLKSLEDMGILGKLSKEKVDAIRNPLSFVGSSDKICNAVLEQAESVRKLSQGAA
jgi:adenylosuccinate lyase